MTKKIASQGDMVEKAISFTEIGKDLWAFTAEGDPNTGVVIGEECVLIIDAQATPRMANQMIEKTRSVTDKPIGHVVQSQHHAVRVPGTSVYHAPQVIISLERPCPGLRYRHATH